MFSEGIERDQWHEINELMIKCRTFFISIRSSHSQMFFKVSVLKNFTIFIGKTSAGVSLFFFFLKACNFIKKRLQHECFPLNIAKFSRTGFYRTPPVATSVVCKITIITSFLVCFLLHPKIAP